MRHSFTSRQFVGSLLRQFFGFAGIGAVGTTGHYFTLIGLVHIAGMGPLSASALGFTVGALINYMLSYKYLFRSQKRHRESMLKFFVVALAGLGLNSVAVKLGIDAAHLHYLVAQLAATAIVLVWNFSINKVWTFSDASKRKINNADQSAASARRESRR